MEPTISNYGILYIDDEEKSLKYFEAIFSDLAPIYTASSPNEGYDIFVEHHDKIGLVLSDNKMPNESGIDLLRRIEAVDPGPFRFLVTAFTDLNVAVDCLNDGLLYSYLSKPWDPMDLEHRLAKALRHYSALQEREALLEEKSKMVQQLVMADKASSMGILSRGLNHHLRNSLTVLRTFYDMLPYQLEDELGRKPQDTEFWNDYYSEVGSQMERMTNMLASLAEGSEARTIRDLETIQFEELVLMAIQMTDLADDGVIFDCPDGHDFMIAGESAGLTQMVRMLVQEARQNAGSEGTVEIGLQANSEEDGLVLEVIDNGPLVPEEERKHLFDPFFVRSDKPEELGLELLACYMTVYRHGGQIKSLKDSKDRNVIHVKLPRRPSQEAADPEFVGDLSFSRVPRSSETALPS